MKIWSLTQHQLKAAAINEKQNYQPHNLTMPLFPMKLNCLSIYVTSQGRTHSSNNNSATRTLKHTRMKTMLRTKTTKPTLCVHSNSMSHCIFPHCACTAKLLVNRHFEQADGLNTRNISHSWNLQIQPLSWSTLQSDSLVTPLWQKDSLISNLCS